METMWYKDGKKKLSASSKSVPGGQRLPLESGSAAGRKRDAEYSCETRALKISFPLGHHKSADEADI